MRGVAMWLTDIREGVVDCHCPARGKWRIRVNGDKTIYAACLYRIQHVAEATTTIPKRITDQHPEVNWRNLCGYGRP